MAVGRLAADDRLAAAVAASRTAAVASSRTAEAASTAVAVDRVAEAASTAVADHMVAADHTVVADTKSPNSKNLKRKRLAKCQPFF